MHMKMKGKIKNIALSTFEFVTYPFAYFCATYMKIVRKRLFLGELPKIKNLLVHQGVFPIIDHYYEPMFNPAHLRYSLRNDRNLPGLDMNVDGQLELLDMFDYADELSKIPIYEPQGERRYYYNNTSYTSGDGEYLYNMIRHFKPKRIIEVGSGYSTLMAIEAIKHNESEGTPCKHWCIEPYEMPWLEKTTAKIIREKLEDVDIGIFKSLEANDILFIDSSHIIRPQGDVLREYLEILPILKSGVVVHIHDIFTPKDYLDEWVCELNKFWNEQYLLEAFLSGNTSYEVIGAVNYLKHNHFEALKEKCPTVTEAHEPGAFWIRKK